MHNQRLSVSDRVMDIVTHNPGCQLEEVMLACPDLTWNQVFSEVDHLSRNGQVRLMQQGMSHYTLSVPGYERTDA